MKLKFFAFLVFLSLAGSIYAQKDRYIGYKYKGIVYGKKLPNGVTDLGGGLLSDESFGVSHFRKGKLEMLWLDKITGYNTDGVPNWIVKDVLKFPSMKKSHEFLFSYSSTCTKNKKEALDMVVLASLNRRKTRYQVLRAWKADVKSEKFISMPIKGIACRVEKP